MSDNIILFSENGTLIVPDYPEIPFIEGDGIGHDIWKTAQYVFDTAVGKAYEGKKGIKWLEIFAGEKGVEKNGESLSDAALDIISQHKVAIKGPLMTPVGKGARSLNVKIRQSLDLYACVRPVKYFSPVPSPVKHPEKVNIIVFRENTEDLYSGIEWDAKSPDAKKVIEFLMNEMDVKLSGTASIGIKPITPEKTKRLVLKALEYAVNNSLKCVTVMHKGNIMKFTEGGFRKWAYQVAKEKFKDQVITEEEVAEKYNGKLPGGKVMLRDRIADMVFAEVLLRPEEFDVIVTTNLNGDYISDALAAQVGGLGIAPGANIGDKCAVFEATHGTAPDIAGKDVANPCSIILSGAMMLDHIGWNKAAKLVRRGVGKALNSGMVTSDLALDMKNVRQVKCSEFGRIIADNIVSV